MFAKKNGEYSSYKENVVINYFLEIFVSIDLALPVEFKIWFEDKNILIESPQISWMNNLQHCSILIGHNKNPSHKSFS